MAVVNPPWPVEWVTTAMLQIAVDGATGWAEATFLGIEGRIACLDFDGHDDLRTWIANVVAQTAVRLVEEGEEISSGLSLAPSIRHRFLADRLATYHARLDELVTMARPRGSA